MAQTGTDEGCRAQATAFMEGLSGCCFFKKKIFFLKEEIQSIYSLEKQT